MLDSLLVLRIEHRRILRAISLVLSMVLFAPAQAKAPQPYQAAPDESALIEHGHYKNKSGEDVHSPAHTKDGKVPAGASAKCRDGSYSFSRTHSGTCSRHGGVAAWLN